VWSPPKARLTAPIKRRLNNTQLPANCCGRKAQLDGKFSALCGFGIKPGYRSCQRDLGVLNHPAVQNMLLAARAFSSRRKPRPLSACRPACTHMPCYRSATPWGGLGQYAASRSPMSSARIGGGSLTGICRDGKPGMCCSDKRPFAVAKNSHAAYWLILTSYHGYRSYALDDKSSRGDSLFTGIVTIMRHSTK
jgi:hypothetical protein